jgi:MFS family permease
MSISLSLGALLLGILTDRLRQRAVRPQAMLAYAALIFIAAQIALMFDLPFSWYMAWSAIAGIGAATVVSYSVVAEYYPTEILGQANAALNTFHIWVLSLFRPQSALW